ncbi:hypothetical protein AAMO2058_001214800 [Amorphochlora amoebiformis]
MMARFHSENGHVGQLGDIYGMGDTGDMGDTDNMGSIGEVGNKSATTSFAGKLNINSAAILAAMRGLQSKIHALENENENLKKHVGPKADMDRKSLMLRQDEMKRENQDLVNKIQTLESKLSEITTQADRLRKEKSQMQERLSDLSQTLSSEVTRFESAKAEFERSSAEGERDCLKELNKDLKMQLKGIGDGIRRIENRATTTSRPKPRARVMSTSRRRLTRKLSSKGASKGTSKGVTVSKRRPALGVAVAVGSTTNTFKNNTKRLTNPIKKTKKKSKKKIDESTYRSELLSGPNINTSNTSNINASNINTSNTNTSNINTSNTNTSNINTSNTNTSNINTSNINTSKRVWIDIPSAGMMLSPTASSGIPKKANKWPASSGTERSMASMGSCVGAGCNSSGADAYLPVVIEAITQEFRDLHGRYGRLIGRGIDAFDDTNTLQTLIKNLENKAWQLKMLKAHERSQCSR